jgi:protein SCO1
MEIQMRKGFVYLSIFIFFGAGGFFLGRFFSGHSRQKESLPVLGQAPDYILTNQLGSPVSSTSFRGKVQVVTFLFTYCRGYCPLIAHNFVALEHVLKATGIADQIQFVAFNVDPENTGPAQMKMFQKQYGWDPSDLHWEFLTGSPEEIRRIVTEGYHVYFRKVRDTKESQESESGKLEQDLTPEPVVSNPLADSAGADYDIIHNDMMVIVDTRGCIRRIFEDAERISDEQFMNVINQLLPPETP